MIVVGMCLWWCIGEVDVKGETVRMFMDPHSVWEQIKILRGVVEFPRWKWLDTLNTIYERKVVKSFRAPCCRVFSTENTSA